MAATRPAPDAAWWAQGLGVPSSLGKAAPTPPPAICVPDVPCGKNVQIPDPCTSGRWQFCHQFL